MHAPNRNKDALLPILNRLYEQIRGVESANHILVGGDDYRPRIEFFHDAVRAHTAGDKADRLTVERLAYDLSFLRHIKSVPLATVKNKNNTYSASTSLVPVGTGKNGAKPDREVRSQLSDLYKNYAVLFAALLAQAADRDYQSRVDELNGEVQDLSVIEQMLAEMEKGKMAAADIQSLAAHLPEPLRSQVIRALHAKQNPKQARQEAAKKLKEQAAKDDRAIASIEKAHFTYVTSQLAVYEDSKEVVKKLAAQGMNVAGSFLQDAVASAMRGARGR